MTPQPPERQQPGHTLRLSRAWLGAELGVRDDVLVEIAHGRFTRVEVGAQRAHGSGHGSEDWSTAETVAGLVLPGLANTHSHVFHRALRGHSQGGHGSFWTWREEMYALADELDPDDLYDLAVATWSEMLLAGITVVGEFHYLHHQRGGRRYDDPNAMGEALICAADEVGIRLTLLDTAYLSSGFGEPVAGAQRRFSDGDAFAWGSRVTDLAARAGAHPHLRVGTAIHSVRAVPRDELDTVVAVGEGRPRHVHLSEQPAENAACLAAHGCTPTALLAEHGALGPQTTAVHATHLTAADVAALGAAQGHVAFCPTTERDLADGVGPARALIDAGSRLTLGSDSHAVIDLFEEMRAVELDARLSTGHRGHHPAAELLTAATSHGHASLDWPDAGRIAVGARADLVVLDPASPRTAGTGADEQSAVFAATAADVVRVMVEGRWAAEAGDASAVGELLDSTIRRLRGKALS